MEILNAGKNFVTIKAAQNEVIDTEQFIPEIGQRRLVISHFLGEANSKLEMASTKDATDWIELNEDIGQLFSNDLVYPRYLRATGATETTIHFVVK